MLTRSVDERMKSWMRVLAVVLLRAPSVQRSPVTNWVFQTYISIIAPPNRSNHEKDERQI